MLSTPYAVSSIYFRPYYQTFVSWPIAEVVFLNLLSWPSVRALCPQKKPVWAKIRQASCSLKLRYHIPPVSSVQREDGSQARLSYDYSTGCSTILVVNYCSCSNQATSFLTRGDQGCIQYSTSGRTVTSYGLWTHLIYGKTWLTAVKIAHFWIIWLPPNARLHS